jgi:hypothetical protein
MDTSKRIHPKRAWKNGVVKLAAGLLALVCGCQCDDGNAPMADSYCLNPYKDVRSLGRVALVELNNTSSYPDISSDMTTALFVALQKRQLFGLNVVHQDDPVWVSLRRDLDSADGFKQVVEMRETLKSDGILVGTITEYQPYPRMVVGLRLKLLDLTDGQLLWGMEQIWDTTDRSVRKRIKDWTSQSPLRDDIVVMSATNFSKFVAYEVAQTFVDTKEPSKSAAMAVPTTWQY